MIPFTYVEGDLLEPIEEVQYLDESEIRDDDLNRAYFDMMDSRVRNALSQLLPMTATGSGASKVMDYELIMKTLNEQRKNWDFREHRMAQIFQQGHSIKGLQPFANVIKRIYDDELADGDNEANEDKEDRLKPSTGSYLYERMQMQRDGKKIDYNTYLRMADRFEYPYMENHNTNVNFLNYTEALNIDMKTNIIIDGPTEVQGVVFCHQLALNIPFHDPVFTLAEKLTYETETSDDPMPTMKIYTLKSGETPYEMLKTYLPTTQSLLKEPSNLVYFKDQFEEVGMETFTKMLNFYRIDSTSIRSDHFSKMQGFIATLIEEERRKARSEPKYSVTSKFEQDPLVRLTFTRDDLKAATDSTNAKPFLDFKESIDTRSEPVTNCNRFANDQPLLNPPSGDIDDDQNETEDFTASYEGKSEPDYAVLNRSKTRAEELTVKDIEIQFIKVMHLRNQLEPEALDARKSLMIELLVHLIRPDELTPGLILDVMILTEQALSRLTDD